MDPRHTLYKTLDKLTVDPEASNTMSARTDQEAASVQASSGVTPEGIERKLREGLGAVYVEIADLSGMFEKPCQASPIPQVFKFFLLSDSWIFCVSDFRIAGCSLSTLSSLTWESVAG